MSSTRSRKNLAPARARRKANSPSSQRASKSRTRSAVGTRATPSSGNVFADIGLPNADEALFKADLAIAIARAIDCRKLSQAVAAKIAGVDQPKISAITSGDLRGFSADRLLRILTRLGSDVRIQIQPSAHAKGRITVGMPSGG